MSLFSDWIKKVENEVESALTFAEPIADDVAKAKAVGEKLLAFVAAVEPAVSSAATTAV